MFRHDYLPLIAALTAAISSPLTFAADDQPATPCSGPGSSEFDFWLGEWEAFDSNDGSLQGREHVTKDYDGCVLTQHWEQQSDRYNYPGSENRMRGTSVTARNSNTSMGSWWQTWVDNVGSVIVLAGGLHDGAMVLEGLPGNSSVRRKWHWKPLEDGSVHSWGTVSPDDDETWQTVWDITYRRPESDSEAPK